MYGFSLYFRWLGGVVMGTGDSWFLFYNPEDGE